MGLSRRRDSSMIWPGFVDAVTVLLMVLMFVLTIFTVMQSVLRETISTQTTELDALAAQVESLADALGLEQARVGELQTEISGLQGSLAAANAEGVRQSTLIQTLTGQLAGREAALSAAQSRITSFEAQVATLLTERDTARGEATALSASVADLQAAEKRLISEQEALQLALSKARTEVDAGAETARLAAARRAALEALIADLRAQSVESDAARLATQAELDAAAVKLTEEQAARLADAAAIAALQAKLQSSDAELTAMTLALEEQRKQAAETLTLLAAAQSDAAKAAAENTAVLTDAQKQAALLAIAEQTLTAEQQKVIESAQRMAVLNEQIAALRGQLGALQAVLDASAAKDAAANVQLDNLGGQLNAALAQVAAEQKRRAELEEAERKRLEAEAAVLAADAQNLEKFRSEFFGQLREVLAGREGVRVVGDRFVFSSEVLFSAGAADLAPEGRAQIAGVVDTLNDVAGQIPPQIDWIIRVDGHTDNVPLSGAGDYADNWELSQARALSVVRYMQDELGFPPERLAATGFGEHRPVADGDSPTALAANRRIELKLTER